MGTSAVSSDILTTRCLDRNQQDICSQRECSIGSVVASEHIAATDSH
jgi:hypothetical protein